MAQPIPDESAHRGWWSAGLCPLLHPIRAKMNLLRLCSLSSIQLLRSGSQTGSVLQPSLRLWVGRRLQPDATQVVYVSPLKALSNDIHRNLEIPLAEIAALAKAERIPLMPIRTSVRT